MGGASAGPVLSMIDTAYVGQVGVMDLAALAPGTLISDVTGYAFSWLGVGTIQIMSSAVAKGDEVRRNAATAARHSNRRRCH